MYKYYTDSVIYTIYKVQNNVNGLDSDHLQADNIDEGDAASVTLPGGVPPAQAARRTVQILYDKHGHRWSTGPLVNWSTGLQVVYWSLTGCQLGHSATRPLGH